MLLAVHSQSLPHYRPRTIFRSPANRDACPICGSSERIELQLHVFRYPWLLWFCLALARKRYHRRNGGRCMKQPQEYATKLAKLPDRIAAIVAKTYAVKGDAAIADGVTDDEALVRIMDLINDLDPTLIERNAKTMLARPQRPS
jgi:hypothetical protein